MITSKLITLLALTATTFATRDALGLQTGKLGDAQTITDNPLGQNYTAQFTGQSGGLFGFVNGIASQDGTGVAFDVHLTGFPSEGGPFRTSPKNLILKTRPLANCIK